MMPKIAHRGPDDEGIYQDRWITIGHKRLSIIDITGGRQPMRSRDGNYIIAYNGEIYNYRELRRRLQKLGYQFATKSDTEVLLYWLIEFGVKGLPHINGMFAFALWNKKANTLLLARDRLGIKPLYYYVRKDILVFASEIKAVLPLVISKSANLNAIYEFLTFQNIISEKTFFENISKLLPGHWLRWTPTCRWLP